jgi:heme-degrading monooxygenase HmoA
LILEVAILNIRPGESAAFERAFAEAQAIIASMPGYGWGRHRTLKRTNERNRIKPDFTRSGRGFVA